MACSSSTARRSCRAPSCPLLGDHNVANALAAALVAARMGADRESIARALRTFNGLPHRHRVVATVAGVRFVDDSKGTNIGATAAGLAGYPAGTIHLILGGLGKGQDFAELRPAVAGRVACVYLIGEATDEIAGALAGIVPVEPCGTLDEAVTRAAAQAKRGDTVLLSPACASFDQFRDYAHRGEEFARLASALPGETADAAHPRGRSLPARCGPGRRGVRDRHGGLGVCAPGTRALRPAPGRVRRPSGDGSAARRRSSPGGDLRASGLADQPEGRLRGALRHLGAPACGVSPAHGGRHPSMAAPADRFDTAVGHRQGDAASGTRRADRLSPRAAPRPETDVPRRRRPGARDLRPGPRGARPRLGGPAHRRRGRRSDARRHAMEADGAGGRRARPGVPPRHRAQAVPRRANALVLRLHRPTRSTSR